MGAAFAGLDTDDYEEVWRSESLVLNTHGSRWIRWRVAKLQLTHEWIRNRGGEAGEGFQPSGVQIQYVS